VRQVGYLQEFLLNFNLKFVIIENAVIINKYNKGPLSSFVGKHTVRQAWFPILQASHKYSELFQSSPRPVNRIDATWMLSAAEFCL